MASSPALKIVRHRKPGDGTGGPVVAGGKLPGRDRAVVATGRRELKMLVLMRKVNESLTITVPPSSRPVEITVMLTAILSSAVSLSKGRARIGINAPPDCKILRSELEDTGHV